MQHNYHVGAAYIDCRSNEYYNCDKCGKHIGGTIYPTND